MIIYLIEIEKNGKWKGREGLGMWNIRLLIIVFLLCWECFLDIWVFVRWVEGVWIGSFEGIWVKGKILGILMCIGIGRFVREEVFREELSFRGGR